MELKDLDESNTFPVCINYLIFYREREISHTVEAFLAGKYEDRPSSGNNMLRTAEVNNSFNPEFRKPEDKPSHANRIARNAKEVSNSLAPELRRSRSTPRGKFMLLP